MNEENKQRNTKIVATIGPASRSPEKLESLIKAGANVFRLNFSHGTHDEHLEVLERIRSASEKLNIPVAVLQDLAGPKIRISDVEENDRDLIDNAKISLKLADGNISNSSLVYVNLVDPSKVLEPGHKVLFADGTILLTVDAVNGDTVDCTIIKGGKLRSKVGIAFPDSDINLPATTEKDLIDLDWGLKNNVDFIAISFVQNAEDITRARKIIKENGRDTKIIAKIELKAALREIDSILEATDAIMVARGDLGVEVPIEELPLIQKGLIAQANYAGKPVIVATQMLHSMVTSIRPTRAEVIDCAFAVMSGADAVMLSEETAIGEHPAEAVGYLDKISRQAEKSFQFEEYRLRLRNSDRATVPDAVAYAACAASIKITASAIIACTETGTTARLVAKYRPQQPLYAVSKNIETVRRMCLNWGVHPSLCPEASSREEEIIQAIEIIKTERDLKKGSPAVILGGLSVGQAGSTSIMEVKVL